MADQRSRFSVSMLAACALAGVSSPAWVVAAAEPAPVAAPRDSGPVKAEAEITFSGYQSLANGGGILFVELTDPVAVEVKRAGQVIEYRLVGARVPLKNNRNPLILRDFRASALSAVLVPEKAGRHGKPAVRLVVTLRNPVNLSHRIVARGKGAALEIELPPPQ